MNAVMNDDILVILETFKKTFLLFRDNSIRRAREPLFLRFRFSALALWCVFPFCLVLPNFVECKQTREIHRTIEQTRKETVPPNIVYSVGVDCSRNKPLGDRKTGPVR